MCLQLLFPVFHMVVVLSLLSDSAAGRFSFQCLFINTISEFVCNIRAVSFVFCCLFVLVFYHRPIFILSKSVARMSAPVSVRGRDISCKHNI